MLTKLIRLMRKPPYSYTVMLLQHNGTVQRFEIERTEKGMADYLRQQLKRKEIQEARAWKK